MCMHIAFTITPSPQVVGVWQQAVFRCQNLMATFIGWRVNETQDLVTLNNPPRDPGITIGQTMDGNGNVVHILTIVAQSNYNETVISCVGGTISGSVNDTTPVKLLIQGEYIGIVTILLCQAVSQATNIIYHVISLSGMNLCTLCMCSTMC